MPLRHSHIGRIVCAAMAALAVPASAPADQVFSNPAEGGYRADASAQAASPRTATRRQPVRAPSAQEQSQTLKNTLTLANLPKAGPSINFEFGAAFHPNASIYIANVDIGNDGVVMQQQNGPIISANFLADANTYYAFECATVPIAFPSSLNYTLSWTSDKETGAPPQAKTLNHDANNVQWIYAAIPKLNTARWIKLKASGFTSSRYLLFCRLTPFS